MSDSCESISFITRYCKENCPDVVYKRVLVDRNKLYGQYLKTTLLCILPIFILNMNDKVVLSLIALAIVFIAPIVFLTVFDINFGRKSLDDNNQWNNFKWYFDKTDKSKPFDMNTNYRSLCS